MTQLTFLVATEASEYAIDTFIDSKKLLSPRTQDLNRFIIRQFCQSSGWPPDERDIISFLAGCQERGLKDSTIRLNFIIVRDFIKFLVRTNQIPRLDLDRIRPPPRPQDLPRSPANASIRRLFEYLESKVEQAIRQDDLLKNWQTVRALAIVSILYDCGLRVGEVTNLKISDLDMAESKLFIRQTKTHLQRDVPFARLAHGDLHLWLDIRRKLTPSLDWLFIAKRGGWRRFSPWGVRNRLKRICESAGIEKITPHQLRHAFAAQALKNGMDVESLQRLLGHASPMMTMRYTRLVGDDLRDIQRRASPRDRI